MKLVFTESAWDDYLWFQERDRKLVKRINLLIKDALRSPFEGIGKPEPLKAELSGLVGGYPDAAEIKARIDAGRIEIRAATRLADPFEQALDLYGLHEGDKAVVRLSLQAAAVEATVTDDRLLFVVLRRCGREALFLPDFVERAVADGAFDTATGQKLLLAVRPRLPVGFVEHSLRRLEGVI
jgi:toxin YoeB